MSLAKTTVYSSITTAITFASGFIVTKVVAVRIGPAGMAQVGQFQNTAAMLLLVASAAIAVGVVKLLAQHRDDQQKQQSVISNAVLMVLGCSAIVSVFTLAASGWLSEQTFRRPQYQFVYLLYGCFVTVMALNVICTSIFNGMQRIQVLTISNIVNSVSGVIATVSLALLFDVRGVLVAVNAAALITFVANLVLLRRLGRFDFMPRLKSLNGGVIKSLLLFSLMTVVAGFWGPVSQLLIRDHIIERLSESDAGYWQGVSRISEYYLSFITTVLSVYYLPKLSELKDKKELRREIARGYRWVLPAVAAIALCIFVLRRQIILILFSPEFLPMESLFAAQLIGDFMKMAAFLLAFLLWAKAMTRTFIITESLFGIGVILISFWCIDRFGLIGATYAFAINYTLYFSYIAVLMIRWLHAPDK